MQEREAAGGGMHRHRNREAEDKLGRGGGGGGPPLPQSPRGTGHLSGARGRQHLGLELEQLSHEAEVGRDDAPALLDELKGLLQLHSLLHDQVGQADGGGAGDASLAVHKDPAMTCFHRVWWGETQVTSGSSSTEIPP